MKKHVFGALLFIFIPAFAQVEQPIRKLKADTASLFNEMRQVRVRKERIVDSIVSLRKRIDTTASLDSGFYHRDYNVDRPSGVRVIWHFLYRIDGQDTIFQGLRKTYTRWDK